LISGQATLAPFSLSTIRNRRVPKSLIGHRIDVFCRPKKTAETLPAASLSHSNLSQYRLVEFHRSIRRFVEDASFHVPDSTIVGERHPNLFLVWILPRLWRLFFTLVRDGDQFHVENQRSIRADVCARAAIAVGQIGWNEQLPFRSYRHEL
jgi:hypothetical protein